MEIKIELSKTEFDYLENSKFLEQKYKNIFSKIKINQENHILMITDDQADILRDIFGEHLQIVGFDEDYNLTKEGEILESLIDKFYTG